MNSRQFLRSILPPLVLDGLRTIRHMTGHPGTSLAYAPLGWETRLPAGVEIVYESARVIAEERAEWGPFMNALRVGHGPLVTGEDGADKGRLTCDHNVFMTFAYVLALAARHTDRLSILDYGGNIGYFHTVARALLPEVALDYHCKELPAMARAGQAINPEVTWHVDDSCLERRYDLVMLDGCLQYLKDWRQLLDKAARASGSYFYLTGVSVVQRAPGFVAIQQHAGAMMLYQLINKAELVAAAHGTGLALVREFWIGQHMPVANAPDQPDYYGCLMKREDESA